MKTGSWRENYNIISDSGSDQTVPTTGHSISIKQIRIDKSHFMLSEKQIRWWLNQNGKVLGEVNEKAVLDKLGTPMSTGYLAYVDLLRQLPN
jgi:hypothetical protein